jgi:hypothetical protein
MISVNVWAMLNLRALQMHVKLLKAEDVGAIEYTYLIGCRKVLVISGASYWLEMTPGFYLGSA